MRIATFSAAAALATALVVAPSPADACQGAAPNTTAKMMKIGKVSAARLSALLKDSSKAGTEIYVYDVNSSKTRAKMGVIPGATLLSSAALYEVDKELPTDKGAGLVFYCSNTYCNASKGAAMRAMRAGYYNVAVLPVGIKGWSEAGLPTEQQQQS